MKVCNKCGEEKEEIEFYTDKRNGRLQLRCKKCQCKQTADISKVRLKQDPEYKKRYTMYQLEYCYNKRRTRNCIIRKPIERLGEKSDATCKIICRHHKEMKDDPEHLTTEFLQKIVGRKCD